MKSAVLNFDGGIREGLMAYGYIVSDPETGERLFCGSRTCGKGTSNVAEYRALIAGLQACLKNKVDIVHIFGDSQLIIKQVLGVYKVNKETLKKHRDYVRKLLDQFNDYSIRWIPRKENKKADDLVNQVFIKRRQKCGKKP
jgi:ribonuclease HI